MVSEASRTRLLAALVSGLGLLAGCGTPSSSTRTERRASPSATYLLEYAARIENDLEILAELVEDNAATLTLTTGTRDSSQEAVRSFVASLSEYRGLLEQLGSDLEDADAPKVRAALTRGEDVHAQLQEKALQLSLIGKVIDSETRGGSDAPPPDQNSPLWAPHEYRRVFHRTIALAASIDNYLNTLHQKSLIPYTNVPHPAEGVFHFLRLRALRDPHLATHSRYFEGAWKAWATERRGLGQFEKSISIFHLVMEMAGEFHPDSLQPLTETLHASLAEHPELAEVEAMEKALDAVKETAEALRKTPEHWEAEFQRLAATLTLVRAYATKDPGRKLSLALEARTGNPLLEERVNALVLETAKAVGDTYLQSEQYEGAVVAFRRTLDLGAIPERERLVTSFRSLAFERGLQAAQDATSAKRFGSSRAILEQLARIAADTSEEQRTRSALHAFYRAHVSRALERDPDAAVEIAQEMIRVFPTDGIAKKKMDDVLFRLLKKGVGDLETSHRRLGSAGVLKLVRGTVEKMATPEGTEDCQRLLAEIEDVWTRELSRAESAALVFSIAFDIARLRGDPVDGSQRFAALALGDYFERVAARNDWDQVEACVNRHLASCPSQPLPPGYREVSLKLLTHLNRRGPAAKLGRHLAIFATTFPDEIDQVRDLIVERMRGDTPEAVSFYALLRAVDPDAADAKAFGESGLAQSSDLEPALERLIGQKELDAARLQGEQARMAAAAAATSAVKTPESTGTTPGVDEPVAAGTSPTADLASRPTQRDAVDREAETDAMLAPLVSAGGVALLLITLVVATWTRGFLAFRWYAFAALWLGITIGLVLGSPSIAAKLANLADARRGALESPAGPASAVGVALAPTPPRTSS